MKEDPSQENSIRYHGYLSFFESIGGYSDDAIFLRIQNDQDYSDGGHSIALQNYQ